LSVDVDPAAEGTDAAQLEPAPPARMPLRSIPRDTFFWVRVTAMSAYATAYVVWTREKGAIIDRISVALSVALLLLCAFAGKPWQRWAMPAVDALLTR